MTDEQRFEREARAWLDLGPTRAPDRTVEAALLEIDQTPQERDLRIPWRLPVMNPLTRVAVAAALVVVTAGAAILVLRLPSGVGVTPTGSPTASVPPSPSGPQPSYPPLSFPPAASPSAPVPGTTALGEGEAMTTGVIYSTRKFTPGLTLTGITGWFLGLEHPDSLWINPSLRSSPYDKTPQIEILRASGVLSSWQRPIPTPEPLPADIIGWLRARPDLTIGPSTSVTVGGVAGTAVDGTVSAATNTDAFGYMDLICAASMATCQNEPYAIGVGLGRPFRIIVQQVQGQTIVIGLNTGGSTSDFDLLEGVIAGLHWVGAP